MPNLIQIKRSLTSATPGALANGELAYTAAGDALFIGSNGSVVAIGGKRTPGTLTANQALVANATSGIDKIIVANLVPTAIHANGSFGSGGQVLASNGTAVYWAAPGGDGTVTQIDSGSGLTGGPITSSGTLSVLANNGIISNATGVYVRANNGISATTDGVFAVGGNGVFVTATGLNVGPGSGIAVGADDVSVLANNGIVSNSTGVFVRANSGIVANATGVFVLANNGITVTSDGVFAVGANGLVVTATGLNVGSGNGIITDPDSIQVRSGSSLTVNTTGVHVNTANLSIATTQLTGDVALGTQTSGNYVATITAGSGITGSATGEGTTPTIAVLANNGIVSNSTGVFVLANTGLVSNSTGVHVLANSGISANSTGVFAVGGNGLFVTATGLNVGAANGIAVDPDSIRVQTGSTLTVNTTGVHVNSTLSIVDLSLSGNLTVSGTLTTIDTQNLVVNDSIIELARSNAADILDIGFFGQYNDGTDRFTGLIWDTSADVYELFTNTTVIPTTTLDTGGTGYTRATLRAFLNTGAFVASPTAVNITANSTVSSAIAANTLTLSTALAGTSGGTGKSTVTSQALLVGNTTNGYNELTLGADGFVLQSNGTAVIYATLDGGSF